MTRTTQVRQPQPRLRLREPGVEDVAQAGGDDAAGRGAHDDEEPAEPGARRAVGAERRARRCRRRRARRRSPRGRRPVVSRARHGACRRACPPCRRPRRRRRRPAPRRSPRRRRPPQRSVAPAGAGAPRTAPKRTYRHRSARAAHTGLPPAARAAAVLALWDAPRVSDDRDHSRRPLSPVDAALIAEACTKSDLVWVRPLDEPRREGRVARVARRRGLHRLRHRRADAAAAAGRGGGRRAEQGDRRADRHASSRTPRRSRPGPRSGTPPPSGSRPSRLNAQDPATQKDRWASGALVALLRPVWVSAAGPGRRGVAVRRRAAARRARDDADAPPVPRRRPPAPRPAPAQAPRLAS